MLCRRNQATLSATQRAQFTAAVLALKASGKYDQYVTDHANAMMGGYAHQGPAFLPWHREFLRRFELDLQSVDASVTLPYWDWTVDNSQLSAIWGTDFLGGNGRVTDSQVMTGPFAFATGNWTLTVLTDGETDPFLKRQFGLNAPALPSSTDVGAALSALPYDVAPWNITSASGFRNTLEGWISGPQLHNLVHVWVGGTMSLMTSPNDPVFFLHHCFVDKIWTDWQAANPTEGYQPAAGALTGHNLSDAMQPWKSLGQNVRPIDVLDHKALGYVYDTEPECSG